MRENRGGFTVIETMIFLAVSGMMFASAILIFRGQQESTQFNQSVRQLDSYLSDVINDTASGVFPEVNDVECRFIAGSLSFVAAVDQESGQSNQCIFLGRVIQIGDGSFAQGADGTLLTYTMVGRNDASSEVRSFADAFPHPLEYTGGGVDFDTVEVSEVSWGTGITKAFYTDNTGTVQYVRGVGVLYSRFGQVSNGSAFLSGTTETSLYAITAGNGQANNRSLSRQNSEAFKQSITIKNAGTPATANIYVPVNDPSVASPITLCLEGAGQDKTAAIELGNAQGSVTTRTNFQPVPECAT